MKCIHCQHDCKYRERTNRRCPNCHKPFAFEPRDGDKITDMAFKHAIDRVSSNGQVRWGVENLYYECCRVRRRRPKGAKILLVVIGVSLFLFMAVTRHPVAIFLTVVVWLVFALVYLLRSDRVPLDSETFDKMWKRWVQTHGMPKGLIQRKPEPERRRKREVEPDVGDYSFDRAVICDRARTVDLLLANNFHFENNCAVLSIGGYPQGPFETVRAMLKRNPRLQVFALHDANAAGCRLAHLLANDPQWFKELLPVTDVGLRPQHSKPFKGLFLPADVAALAAGQGIASDEVPWLARNALELAAIRPEQVLKRLYRAINRKFDQPRHAAHDWVGFDTESFSADAGDSDGGADSFG